MIPRLKVRGFEVARGWEDKDITLPAQATERAAGYDFFAAVDLVIPPHTTWAAPMLVPTGVKAYMKDSEYLLLANRSSNPKRGLILANGVGIVDADYYENPTNDGLILFAFLNVNPEPVEITKGDRIGQGIFQSYLRADSPRTKNKRVGGFGSTDAKN